jgi:hypothetical protein
MKELVVLGFASRELAEEASSLGAELRREGMLHLDGAALAYRRDEGRVEPPRGTEARRRRRADWHSQRDEAISSRGTSGGVSTWRIRSS